MTKTATPRPPEQAAQPHDASVPPLRRTVGPGPLAAKYGLLAVAVVIVTGFSLAVPDTYPTVANAQTIASNSAVIAFLALAAMLPLVTGQFDVSLGYQLGLSQTLTAGLIVKQDMAWPVAVAVAIGACLVVGLVNGLLVTRLNIASFIVTLGVGTVVYGVTQAYSGDQTILGTLPDVFTSAGRSTVLGIPLPLVYVVVAVGILWVALELTPWGRGCVATGGSPTAARLSGIRTDRLIVQSFVSASLLAGIAGVLSVMLLGASAPTVGLGELLPAFAGAFLGATAFRPGRFNSLGTFVAVYMLAAGISGLQQLGAHFYVQQLFNGGALLLAVSIAALAARRSAPRTT
jgi:ribose transport system permease protein